MIKVYIKLTHLSNKHRIELGAGRYATMPAVFGTYAYDR